MPTFTQKEYDNIYEYRCCSDVLRPQPRVYTRSILEESLQFQKTQYFELQLSFALSLAVDILVQPLQPFDICPS